MIRELAMLLREEKNHPVGVLARAYLASEKLAALREKWSATPDKEKAKLVAEALKRVTVRTGTRERK